MMDWIKCTDRMPQDGDLVLVTSVWEGRKYVEYAQYENEEFFGEAEGCIGDRWEIDGVTHWMPMPEPAED